MNGYYVYILECVDKTLYTGWTSNIAKRVREYNGGKDGVKYTRARRPEGGWSKLRLIRACQRL